MHRAEFYQTELGTLLAIDGTGIAEGSRGFLCTVLYLRGVKFFNQVPAEA